MLTMCQKLFWVVDLKMVKKIDNISAYVELIS